MHLISHIQTIFQHVPLHKKMKFSIKDFFSKCDQICSFLAGLEFGLEARFLRARSGAEIKLPAEKIGNDK